MVLNLLFISVMEMPVLVGCSKEKKSQTSVFLKNNTASFPSGGEMS